MANVQEILEIYNESNITLNGYNAEAYEYPDNKIYILEEVHGEGLDSIINNSGLIVDIPNFIKTILHKQGKFKTK